MKTTHYRKMERDINAHDSGRIWERWRFGRLLLVDEDATTANGHLRNGVLDQLIKAVTRDGFELSEREVQRRLQLARKYPTEDQFRQAVGIGTWTDILNSALPDVAAEEGDRPYDPRTDAELRTAADHHNPLPHDFEQLRLFPHAADDDTLAELRRYLEEQEELTARFADRDELRRAYFERLVKAVGGDESRTYGEAKAALSDDEEVTVTLDPEPDEVP